MQDDGAPTKRRPGRPKGVPSVVRHVSVPLKPISHEDVVEIARGHAADMIATLASVAVDATQPAAARVRAAEALLDRGYGRPPVMVQAAVLQRREVVITDTILTDPEAVAMLERIATMALIGRPDE